MSKMSAAERGCYAACSVGALLCASLMFIPLSQDIKQFVMQMANTFTGGGLALVNSAKNKNEEASSFDKNADSSAEHDD